MKASIARGVADQARVQVLSVSCPERREARPGDRFECAVTVDGGVLRVVASQDEYANVRWELRDKVLDVAQIEAKLREGLLQHLRLEASVSCGPRARPASAGLSFECEAAHGRERMRLRVTVTGTDGTFHWAPLPSAPAPPAKP